MAGENAGAVDNGFFKLEILTPQKSVYSGEVESFTAPGTLGSFQVLRDHAPFLTTISVGEVKVLDQSGNESFYSTSGGFVEVNHNHVSFLADTVERRDEINIARATSAKERAEARLMEKEPGLDIARAKAALARALNRIKIAGR
jgi:F-type H+-transporting ATPase subunit epsilon